MATVTLARRAMATRFEIVLHGGNAVSLRAAGEAALDEIQRLEAKLSLYRGDSEIARLNARAAREPVRVTPEVFALLQRAKELSAETNEMFDITVAPLVRCWGFMGGEGKVPDATALAEARTNVGMNLVRLNEPDYTVEFDAPGVMLDLGAIGKGYAIDQAAEVLREAGVTSALIHGGTSTAYAIGAPPDAYDWKIAIEQPRIGSPAGAVSAESPARRLLATVPLKDESLSVSAVWGKSFESEGKSFGHVLDPRTGQPVANALLAAVSLPSATETDAFSTALLICGRDGHEQIRALRPGMRTLLVTPAGRGFKAEATGIEVESFRTV
jgi:thiamine biosynthesis lipoprotein